MDASQFYAAFSHAARDGRDHRDDPGVFTLPSAAERHRIGEDVDEALRRSAAVTGGDNGDNGDRSAYEVVLRCPVELDPRSAPPFEALLASVDSGDDVVIDLRDVRFCDSSGLRTFVTAHRRFSEGGGSLVLEHPSPALRRLFEICGLDGHLPVRP